MRKSRLDILITIQRKWEVNMLFKSLMAISSMEVLKKKVAMIKMMIRIRIRIRINRKVRSNRIFHYRYNLIKM